MGLGRRDLLAACAGAAAGAATARVVGSRPEARGVQVEVPGQPARAFTGAPVRLFVPSVNGEESPEYDAEHPFFGYTASRYETAGRTLSEKGRIDDPLWVLDVEPALERWFQGARVVADLGAAEGRLGHALAQRVGAGGQVFLVDANANDVRFMAHRFRAEGDHGRIVAVQNQMTDVCLPVGAIDCMRVGNVHAWVSDMAWGVNSVEEHVIGALRFWSSVRDCLAPGGHALVIDYEPHPVAEGPPAGRFTSAQAAEIVQRAGLDLVEEQRDVTPGHYLLVFRRSSRRLPPLRYGAGGVPMSP